MLSSAAARLFSCLLAFRGIRFAVLTMKYAQDKTPSHERSFFFHFFLSCLPQINRGVIVSGMLYLHPLLGSVFFFEICLAWFRPFFLVGTIVSSQAPTRITPPATSTSGAGWSLVRSVGFTSSGLEVGPCKLSISRAWAFSRAYISLPPQQQEQ